MAFTSIHKPEFWGILPERPEALNQPTAQLGLASSHFLMGRREDNPPLVTPRRMEPGFVLTPEPRDCHCLDIIVEGSLQVGGRILKAGDVILTEPGKTHGPRVAGPEGCVTFDICSDLEAVIDSRGSAAKCS